MQQQQQQSAQLQQTAQEKFSAHVRKNLKYEPYFNGYKI